MDSFKGKKKIRDRQKADRLVKGLMRQGQKEADGGGGLGGGSIKGLTITQTADNGGRSSCVRAAESRADSK